jgi:hypothetical protein
MPVVLESLSRVVIDRLKRAFVGLALLAPSCAPTPAVPTSPPLSGAACEAQKRELIALLDALPARALMAPLQVEPPECAVGELPRGGALLEIAESAVILDGAKITLPSLADRVARTQAWLEQGSKASDTVYVAAAPSIDVQTLRAYLSRAPRTLKIKLLVRMPAQPGASTPSAAKDAARELAARLLDERDPRAREELAKAGYAQFASCASVSAAVHSLAGLTARERWPRLREALRAALGRCRCGELDAESLKALLVAEQRAGTASLAALPLGFLRDERCGASMPLRSLGKLVTQIEAFDREFSGSWQKEALEFDAVLTDQRLVNTFCNALPGETLAALERARATLYWKVSGSESCEPWRFEPLAPGAPMGTWRQLGADPKSTGLAFHYWQGAEEIRLFGPAIGEPPSKPTDRHDWACDQNLRLLAVDEGSIQLEHGRWFFSESACRSAPADARSLATGCVSVRAAADAVPSAPSAKAGKSVPPSPRP